MASISKRGESWWVRIKHKGKVVASKTFKLKAHAAQWALEQEVILGAPVTEQHSFRDMLETYRDNECPKKPGQRWEQIRINKFLRDLPFRDKMLCDITTDDIAKWRDARLKQVKPGSVRREMVLLSAIFTLARREWGWVSVSPMLDVKKPTGARARKDIWYDDQIEAVLEHITNHDVRVIFLLAIETGMRSGEMVGLTWDQVDLKKRVAHLDKTKNGDERDVPLSMPAVKLLKELPGKSGRCFSVTDAIRDTLFREARDAAGLKGHLTFHDTRATALTRLAKKVDVLTLARISGHRDLKSLMVYYRESAEDIAKRL